MNQNEEYVPMGGQKPPAPGSWHPAYSDMPWLADWLADDKKYDAHIPIPSAPRAFFHRGDGPGPTAIPRIRTMRMVKHPAAAPAPWTDWPFDYRWVVGVDELGRMIAGPACPRQWLNYEPLPSRLPNDR